MPTVQDAKNALDKVIEKSRVHLYKPIQIAEILYQDRVNGQIDLLELEDYRTKSRKWRDEISIPLLGRKCTSSARFQDNLFEENAVPPILLNELGKENKRTNGAVEAYIYRKFTNKHSQLSEALEYCLNASKEDFQVEDFINSFWEEPGLKRSLDKVYEIIVYALFSTLVNAMGMRVQISVNEKGIPLLEEFEDFSKKVMCIDASNPIFEQDAHVYRVGVTNAADRGLDMYSNWGPAIQIKHLSLSTELAEDIVESISNDRIVIVCKDVEKDIIVSLLTQIGWRSRIQSVITENDLITWYEKALRGTFSDELGSELLATLCEEIALEFPSIDDTPQILKERNYSSISDPFWI